MRTAFFWRYILLLLPAPALALVFLVLAHAGARLSAVAFISVFALVCVTAAIASSRRALRRVSYHQHARALAEGNSSARLPLGITGHNDLAIAWNNVAEQMERRFAELKAEREQLSLLLNSLQEGVLTVDANTRVTWANRAIERQTGQRAPLREPLVHTVRDPDALGWVNAALTTGTAQRGMARLIAEGRIFEVSATPMPGGAVAVLTDVTEKAQIESVRRDFIANVSHELRTPLTSIRGYVETLLEDPELNDEQRDFLEIILKNARRMARLAEDLLALARVESGEHKLRLEPIPASLLLNDVRDSLTGLVVEHGMILEVAFTSERAVMADRDAVYQVLSNLVENAAKYAADGGRITLGAIEKGGFTELFVRDFGPGIRAEHQPRIFERFFRVDKARSMESGGTGLGLAIAKHIALAHGGSIRVESSLNHGATFILSLVAAEED